MSSGNKHPALDPRAGYAEVIGDPEVRYLQAGKMFSANGEYVREAPEAHTRTPEPQRALPPSTEQIMANVAAKIGARDVVPAALREAEKENAQARAAEEWDGDE